MAADQAVESRLSSCCISHEFFRAASKYPDKIAVIHSFGFAELVRQSTTFDRPRDGSGVKFAYPETASSSGPPVYGGDKCFTFSDIISAVDNLSYRLRHILCGGDDPCMITASSASSFSKRTIHDSETLEFLNQSVQQSTMCCNVQTPKVVGLYMEPSVEYIVAVLSVLRCGEAFMPLDPMWPKARILSLISSSKADLVIGIGSASNGNCFHRLDKLKWLIDEGSCPVLPVSMEENIERHSPPSQLEWPCESKRIRSFCYLMYTSGSSGKPKGVCGTEIGLLNRFLWMQEMYPLDDKDVVLFKTAISFIDHIQEILGAILTACTLVIPPHNQLKENIFCIVEFLQGYLITRLMAVPSLIRAILPSLQSSCYTAIRSSLKLLVLSGETFHLSLCKILLKLLPQTSILNLYGSTELAGDCTYFDCKSLSTIVEKEILMSVPIGLPLSNCDVVLVGEDAPYQGEIYVGGLCVAAGYFHYPNVLPLVDDDLSQEHDVKCRLQRHFKTGDFARKLPSGDLVFLGRKDRIIKVNGQRIALEEIESVLRDHPNVVDAAVLSHELDGEILLLEAHVMKERTTEDDELLKTSLRNLLHSELPLIMVPSRILLVSSLPFLSSGKVDYSSLAASTATGRQARINIQEIPEDHVIHVIKQVFSEALTVERVSIDDDFFAMGGDSISAAYVSFKLGIHMKLLYSFPTPMSLRMALLSSSSYEGPDPQFEVDLSRPGGLPISTGTKVSNFHERAVGRRDIYNPGKKLKVASKEESTEYRSWNPTAVHVDCSFSRSNKSTHGGQCKGKCPVDTVCANIIPRDGKGFMQEQWKVNMGSCVDASPLVVFKDSDIYLFIGSHSHMFMCIDGQRGVVHWEAKLEGRIECSAVILDDFSQVVVGCYHGNIYFLHFSNGNVCGSFQTDGEKRTIDR